MKEIPDKDFETMAEIFFKLDRARGIKAKKTKYNPTERITEIYICNLTKKPCSFADKKGSCTQPFTALEMNCFE